MTKFNRRAFMSVAGIAAAETASSPLVSARSNRSGLSIICPTRLSPTKLSAGDAEVKGATPFGSKGAGFDSLPPGNSSTRLSNVRIPNEISLNGGNFGLE